MGKYFLLLHLFYSGALTGQKPPEIAIVGLVIGNEKDLHCPQCPGRRTVVIIAKLQPIEFPPTL